MTAKNGGDAHELAVPDVGPAHLDALVGRPRDVGVQEDLLLA